MQSVYVCCAHNPTTTCIHLVMQHELDDSTFSANGSRKSEMCYHGSNNAGTRGVTITNLNILPSFKCHQVQTSSEKQRILARQHGSAVKPAGPPKAGATSAASAQQPAHAISRKPEDIACLSLSESESLDGGLDGGGVISLPHPSVLIPAVRAVAALMTADHASAGPLRKQYQANIHPPSSRACFVYHGFDLSQKFAHLTLVPARRHDASQIIS